MIARRGGALALIGLISGFVAGCGENPSPTPAIVAAAVSPDQLVGKWGFAAYHKDEDRARTIKEASAQCNRPYVIAKGPTGGVMMNLADQKELSELFLKAGPNGQTYLGPAGAAAAPTTASSPMSMRTRSRRFGSIQTMRVAMARQFTCGAESANQRSNLGFDPVSPIDGARMTVRVSLLLRLALGAAFAAFAGAGAGAQTPGQDEMNVVDQPGYQPTPEEEQLSGAYEKQEVFFRTTEAPGTIIIDTKGRFLYLVQGNNRALRYGIGVGREGFTWSGLQKIARKQEWPDWRPPPEMIERQPYLPRFMAGGPGNPLGARAMYLGATVYRIHGTNQPDTIGHAVSSGCFRLVNADVIDLYDRVPVGTKVIIRQAVAL